MTTASKSALLLLAALLLAACAPSANVKPPAAPPAAAAADDTALATDPCAIRLQDISSAMLFYVIQHKEMPHTLEDVRILGGTAAADPKFFTCPTTGQPYIYVRAGLSVPGQERLLVVYDSVADSAGLRWGIVAAPADGNRPLTMLVVRLTQRVLDTYLLSAPAGK
jgi:hypothetical protein